MIKLNHLIKEHLIYEGLIHSVSLHKFDDLVSRWAIVNDKIKIKFSRWSEKIHIVFLSPPSADELDNLLKLINNLGWYVSVYSLKNKSGWIKFDRDNFTTNEILINLQSFQIEAKFDLDISDWDFDVLYHVTPSVNDSKIQKIGLVPKNVNKIAYHPERIYFAKSPEAMEIIAKQFNKLDPELDHFSVYEIDIKSAMKDNPHLRLFKDPNFGDGIYTLSNIHPKHIKFLRAVGFEK